MIFVYTLCILLSLVGTYIGKYKKLLSCFVFVLLCVVYFNVIVGNQGDLWEYERMYNYIRNGDEHLLMHATEPIYVLLEKTFVFFEVSFVVFRNTMYLLSLSILAFHAKKYTNNVAFFLAAYALYYFLIDGYQMRSMMAFSVLVFGFSAFIRNERYCCAKFFVSVIISSMIQRTFLLFLVFLIGKVKRKFGTREIVAICSGTMIAFISEYKFKIISSLLLFDQYGQIYTDKEIHLGWLIPVFMYMLSFTFFYYVCNHTMKWEDATTHQICVNMFKINAVCMLFVPFLIINLTFYRYIRYGMLMNLFLYSVVEERIGSKDKRIVFAVAVYSLSIALLLCDCRFHGGFFEIVLQQFLHL